MDKISITLYSNGMSHHQITLCEYLASREDVDFHFVATKPVAKERLEMGYDDLNHAGGYIIRSYEDEASERLASDLSETSDFVIHGSAPYRYIKNRLRRKQWTFIYSERIFKNGLCDRKLLKKIAAYFLHYGAVPHEKMGLLCASAYAPKDFRYFGLDPDKMYKWGYFPPDTKKDIGELLNLKQENSILWVGRMIPWKHPELPVLTAERLRDEKIPFRLTMVGAGECFREIEDMIRGKNLEEYVTLTGSLAREQVREIMEESDIQLATSDRREGWGAVINEGMNSGCALVASDAMGAAPFLIQDSVNSYLFKSGDTEELYRKTKMLLTDPEEKVRIQKEAFAAIREEWNGENAGRKLTELCRQLKEGNTAFRYESGICSPAE